jgi:hypothetical protein
MRASCTVITTRAWTLVSIFLTSVWAPACLPPPSEEDIPAGDEGSVPTETPAPAAEDEGEVVLAAPGGAFLDLQCGGKHRRHSIGGVTYQGAKYAKTGGVETFEHLDRSCNRVEIDTNVHYKGGVHTFEGDVRIGQVSGQSVVQIFDAPSSGPIMMIKAYESGGGTLRKLAGSVELASGISNEWVGVRIVHNLDANTLRIYINGRLEWSGSGGEGGSFNLKYGNYGTGAPTKVQWRNVSW